MHSTFDAPSFTRDQDIINLLVQGWVNPLPMGISMNAVDICTLDSTRIGSGYVSVSICDSHWEDYVHELDLVEGKELGGLLIFIIVVNDNIMRSLLLLRFSCCRLCCHSVPLVSARDDSVGLDVSLTVYVCKQWAYVNRSPSFPCFYGCLTLHSVDMCVKEYVCPNGYLFCHPSVESCRLYRFQQKAWANLAKVVVCHVWLSVVDDSPDKEVTRVLVGCVRQLRPGNRSRRCDRR